METQVVNQCSRAIVRNVMNKVVVGSCPTTQQDISKDQYFTSEGQKHQDEHEKREREMKVNIEACDVQTAFIDKSATNFINSVFSSPNSEENKINR